jgi:hypothetical protein
MKYLMMVIIVVLTSACGKPIIEGSNPDKEIIACGERFWIKEDASQGRSYHYSEKYFPPYSKATRYFPSKQYPEPTQTDEGYWKYPVGLYGTEDCFLLTN